MAKCWRKYGCHRNSEAVRTTFPEDVVKSFPRAKTAPPSWWDGHSHQCCWLPLPRPNKPKDVDVLAKQVDKPLQWPVLRDHTPPSDC